MCCCQGSGCTRVYLRSFQIFVEFFVRRWNQWCRTLLLHHSHFSEIQMKNGRNTNEKWRKYKWKMDEIQIKQGRNTVEWFAEIYSVTVFCATVKPMMLDTLPALQPLPFHFHSFIYFSCFCFTDWTILNKFANARRPTLVSRGGYSGLVYNVCGLVCPRMEEKIFSLMLWPIWCRWLEQSNPSPRLHWSAAAGVLTNTNTNMCQCHFQCFPKQIKNLFGPS